MWGLPIGNYQYVELVPRCKGVFCAKWDKEVTNSLFLLDIFVYRRVEEGHGPPGKQVPMDAGLLAPNIIPHAAPPRPPQDIVAEANHRIANSLTLLVGMVRLQAVSVKKNPAPLSNAEVRMLLEGIAARIGTIGQLHRLLSHAGQDGSTSLRPHLRELSDALVAALSSPEQMVTVTHTGSDCMVMTRQIQPIILILCEAFINAMKYAHPTGVPLAMTVDCSPSADGRLNITVADDGIGLPDGFDPYHGGGLGFRVIRSLAAEIGASLEIHSCELGLSFRLSVPIAAMPGGKLS